MKDSEEKYLRKSNLPFAISLNIKLKLILKSIANKQKYNNPKQDNIKIDWIKNIFLNKKVKINKIINIP